MTMSSRADNRTLTYGEAVFEATRSEMARDPSVFVMGQGVDDARGMFGTTLGLHREFAHTIQGRRHLLQVTVLGLVERDGVRHIVGRRGVFTDLGGEPH